MEFNNSEGNQVETSYEMTRDFGYNRDMEHELCNRTSDTITGIEIAHDPAEL